LLTLSFLKLFILFVIFRFLREGDFNIYKVAAGHASFLVTKLKRMTGGSVIQLWANFIYITVFDKDTFRGSCEICNSFLF
jgi:hypothetical protein